ncbi:MAG TPA: YihY/virulence factor BrkB family protein [Gaiella sp.]|jgi:membrane protein|nr:YihY/virulence factor BrkB family protein [Gaiella sp.]
MPTHADTPALGPSGSATPDRSGARRLRDISLAEWREISVSAVKESLDDNVPMMASALAYSAFFAIPAALLLLLGVFTLVADESTITHLVDRLTEIAPSDAADLFGNSLRHLSQRASTGITLTLVGLGLALWSATNAMGTVITALNVAYDRDDSRGFVRSRLVALAMAVFVGGAAMLAGGLLIMGPHLQAWLGSAVDARRTVELVWWIGQWPILVSAFLFAFAVVLYLGPDVEHRRWRLISPGAVVAVVVWLVVSGIFSFYTAHFGTYDKTWGTLGAVIVTLIWLWLAGLSLLFGGELNAETERRAGALDGRGARVPR